jgi:hypothetical protein
MYLSNKRGSSLAARRNATTLYRGRWKVRLLQLALLLLLLYAFEPLLLLVLLLPGISSGVRPVVFDT